MRSNLLFLYFLFLLPHSIIPLINMATMWRASLRPIRPYSERFFQMPKTGLDFLLNSWKLPPILKRQPFVWCLCEDRTNCNNQYAVKCLCLSWLLYFFCCCYCCWFLDLGKWTTIKIQPRVCTAYLLHCILWSAPGRLMVLMLGVAVIFIIFVVVLVIVA